VKGDSLYWITARLLDVLIWGGELVNEEDLPAAGPAVFVSNHADAMGPIAIASSLPVRIYPWVIADMLEWGKAADYLRKDFVEPQLHIPPPLSMPISRLISQASVRLLRSVESIPAWHGEEVLETYRISVNYLIQGRSLLIFPEDPTQPKDELHKMRPFKKGFARLGELYYERTNKILQFYPLAVHPAELKVKVGKPISFNPFNDRVRERLRIKNILESMIRELYLSMILESHIAIPLPH
jgi:1-acyl-sn-glycerol-3-phosphate acyltransferase